MSPNERLKSQPVPEISTSLPAQQNVSLALRPLAPKSAPRFRPLAIRGSSESLLLSSQRQGQQTGQGRGRTPVRCPVCFRRHCPIVSHKFHDEARRLRRSQTFFAARTTVPQDSLSASYGVDFAALYDEPTPGPDVLGILSQLPIPEDLHRPLMCQLFHHCKRALQYLLLECCVRSVLTISDRVRIRSVNAFYGATSCAEQQ